MKRGWICGALQATILIGCAPVDNGDMLPEDVLAQAAPAAPSLCPGRDLQVTPVAPNVLFLLDKSSSMAGLDPRNHLKSRWAASAGVVRTIAERFQGAASFGLITFPSERKRDDGCGAGEVQIELGLAGGRFSDVSMEPPLSWSATPTARALDVAAAMLGRDCTSCSAGPRSIVLITDGQPTCGPLDAFDPDAIARVETLLAIGRLRSMGVRTYMIGYDIASDPQAAAVMSVFAKEGGTDRAYAVEHSDALLDALSEIVGEHHPCAFELMEDGPDSRPLVVSVDGVWLPREAWHLQGGRLVLDSACDLVRDGQSHDVRASRSCPPTPPPTSPPQPPAQPPPTAPPPDLGPAGLIEVSWTLFDNGKLMPESFGVSGNAPLQNLSRCNASRCIVERRARVFLLYVDEAAAGVGVTSIKCVQRGTGRYRESNKREIVLDDLSEDWSCRIDGYVVI